MQELVAERVEVGVGESLRIVNDLVAGVDGPSIMGRKGFQGQLVFAEGPAVVAHHDFGGKPILPFLHDFVSIIEKGALARVERAAHDHAGSGRPAQQGCQLRRIIGPGIFFEG